MKSITTFAKNPNTNMGTTVRVTVPFRRLLNVTFALHMYINNYYAVDSVKFTIIKSRIFCIRLLDAVRIIKNYIDYIPSCMCDCALQISN